jgi:hypothetical protein
MERLSIFIRCWLLYTPFGIGGGLAVRHGISVLRHSEPVIHSSWNYAVLVFSAAFDFYSWRISYLELRTQKKRGESVWDEVVGSKDPSIFTVFLEDRILRNPPWADLQPAIF